MLEIIAISYIVSVSLYLARQYPDFPKRLAAVDVERIDELAKTLDGLDYIADKLRD